MTTKDNTTKKIPSEDSTSTTKLRKVSISSLEMSIITMSMHIKEEEMKLEGKDSKNSKKTISILIPSPISQEVVDFFEEKGVTISSSGMYLSLTEGSGYQVTVSW